MITEEFIEKIVDKMTGLKSDHDLLVKIATTLESISKSNEDERERVAIAIADLKNKVDSAHIRIDGVVKFHYMTLGSVATIGIVITVVLFVLKIGGME